MTGLHIIVNYIILYMEDLQRLQWLCIVRYNQDNIIPRHYNVWMSIVVGLLSMLFKPIFSLFLFTVESWLLSTLEFWTWKNTVWLAKLWHQGVEHDLTMQCTCIYISVNCGFAHLIFIEEQFAINSKDHGTEEDLICDTNISTSQIKLSASSKVVESCLLLHWHI